MRVLVTGGTGFIGTALVKALGSRGDEAIVVSRHPGPNGVTWEAIEDEVARADAIVHLAGESVAGGRWTDERLERIRSSRVVSTARIAKAIERAARKPRVFVSGSAVGIYGMRRDDVVLDESSPAADDVLARITVAWENAAEPARQAGVRVAHPRTGIVLGNGGGALDKLVTPFKWFVGGPVGNGRQWVSWIHLRDEVRALLFAVDNEAMTGPFNVVGPSPVTMETVARAIATTLHRPDALRVPSFALRLALGDGLAEALLTGQRAVPRKLLDAGFKFDFTDIGSALSDLLRNA